MLARTEARAAAAVEIDRQQFISIVQQWHPARQGHHCCIGGRRGQDCWLQLLCNIILSLAGWDF